jgi:hypothetical protein
MAVSQDTTLTAQGTLGYLYKINLEGVNPYQNRLDQMKKELEEKVNEEDSNQILGIKAKVPEDLS